MWLVGRLRRAGVALPLAGLIILNIANSPVCRCRSRYWVRRGRRFSGRWRSVSTIGYYAAYGLLVAVTPLMLWLAWRGKFSTCGAGDRESAEIAATLR
jgi:hypothetical protein